MQILFPRRRSVWAGGGGTTWEPAYYGNQGFWIDASQLTGFSDTDPVDVWTDVYGNMDYSAPTASNEPEFKDSFLNGLPVISSASGDYMQTSSTSHLSSFTGNFTFWCVWRHTSVYGTLHPIFFKGNGATAAGTMFEFTNWNGANKDYFQTRTSVANVVLYSPNYEDTSWHYAVITRNGSSLNYWEDAAVSAVSGTLSGTLNAAAVKPTIFGTSSGTYTGQNVQLAECGMVGEYIGSSSVSDLRTELAYKWGL